MKIYLDNFDYKLNKIIVLSRRPGKIIEVINIENFSFIVDQIVGHD